MNQNKKLSILLIFVSLVLFGITFFTFSRILFLQTLIYGSTNTNALVKNQINPEDENYYKYFKMFREAYLILKREFYQDDKVTAKNMLYGAINGMMESTGDPYTTFMEPEISQEFYIDMKSSFGGLGIQIDIRDGWLTVVSPIEDTPAWRVGLKPNDKIIEIETNSTKGISVNEAIGKLRGKPGTKVTITIVREGIEGSFKVTLTREEIIIKTVKSTIITNQNKRFAYIKMTEFSQPTAEEFRKMLNVAIKQNPDGLIVDLRNNPGGLLDVVINCVNFFIDKGLIVYTRGRLEENNRDYFASKGLTFVPLELPMVVLVNEGSASASEIFAGAMKDTGRAVIVGHKTFGKGSVQKTYAFAEDGSLIKYTVSRYFTPSGYVIDKTGLLPDAEELMWYEKIDDREKKDFVRLQNTNIIRDFVKANPNPTREQIVSLRDKLIQDSFNISIDTLRWLVRFRQHENTMPPLYDLEFDSQLVKTLDILNNFQEYKKKVVYYEKAK